MELLKIITELSHEFGQPKYVRGGGGNTSAKDADTLWVKPSGTTLTGLQPETFVAMDRALLGRLDDVEPPADSAAREAMVKEMMLAAVRPGAAGRPSVEAPLHNTFAARYVVHTHPAAVNGLTCARDGAAACAELFPDALWIPYTDPGYTLCMAVRKAIAGYREANATEPALVFLENHGLFVAADAPEDLRALYRRVMERLLERYREKGVLLELARGPHPRRDRVDEDTGELRAAVGPEDAAYITVSGLFPVALGPLTPDHIVYAKAYPLVGEPSEDAVESFRSHYGYPPRVVATDDAVYGLGGTPRNAELALEFAEDGALVQQLTEAFGGVHFMTDRARAFIDNWEVEAYRRKVAQ